jgi:uncharacterized protein with HEPN domain
MSRMTLNAPSAHPNRYSLTDPSIPVPSELDRVRHMLEAIDRLEEMTSRFSTADFLVEELPQDAVCRAFGILGTAAGAVSAGLQRTYPAVAWKRWEQYGADLLTNYDEIDYCFLRHTATSDLPELRQELKKILEIETKPSITS